MIMKPLPILYFVPGNQRRRWLRRYVSNSRCPGPKPIPGAATSYHNAEVLIGDFPQVKDADGCIAPVAETYEGDARWPARCACGYEFTDADERQVFTRELWVPHDGHGDLTTIEEMPEGAMWDAWWHHDWPQFCGPDGRSLHVKLPGGHHWCIDSQASNCDQPHRPHKCWVRTGTPPLLNVTKGAPGESCNAGAGSILVPNWHGFLRNGQLVSC